MCVDNSEQKNLKTLDGGWKEGWVDGWMDGSQSRVKDCLQQSKTNVVYFKTIDLDLEEF